MFSSQKYGLSGVYYFSSVSRSYRVSVENLRIIRVEPNKGFSFLIQEQYLSGLFRLANVHIICNIVQAKCRLAIGAGSHCMFRVLLCMMTFFVGH